MNAGVVFLRVIVLCIPVVNVMVALVWGFSSEDEETRRWGRVALLVMMGLTVAAILFGVYGIFSLKSIINTL